MAPLVPANEQHLIRLPLHVLTCSSTSFNHVSKSDRAWNRNNRISQLGGPCFAPPVRPRCAQHIGEGKLAFVKSDSGAQTERRHVSSVKSAGGRQGALAACGTVEQHRPKSRIGKLDLGADVEALAAEDAVVDGKVDCFAAAAFLLCFRKVWERVCNPSLGALRDATQSLPALAANVAVISCVDSSENKCLGAGLCFRVGNACFPFQSFLRHETKATEHAPATRTTLPLGQDEQQKTYVSCAPAKDKQETNMSLRFSPETRKTL